MKKARPPAVTFILHPSSLILSLRDGATGSTSDFEFEDEGSTPSPAAKLILIKE